MSINYRANQSARVLRPCASRLTFCANTVGKGRLICNTETVRRGALRRTGWAKEKRWMEGNVLLVVPRLSEVRAPTAAHLTLP